MAPAGESDPWSPNLLDKCLSGEYQLWTWRDIYEGLCDSETASKNGELKRYMTDDNTTSILSQPFKPYEDPTPQTRASFETRTAAIHVTPSDNNHYNINEIKEDSLWLSKEAKVDETSALRLVIIEWQARPAARLLSGFTEEETLSIQDAAGRASLRSSTLLNSSILATPVGSLTEDLAAFSSAEQRRLRLLSLYLSEKVYCLRVYEILVRTAATRQTYGDAGAVKKGKNSAPWQVDVGNVLLEAQNTSGQFAQGDGGFMSRCIAELGKCMDRLDKGSRWFTEEGGDIDIEESWGRCQIVEMTHIMQLILNYQSSLTELTPAVAALAWFRFVGQHGFFREFEMLFPSQQTLIPLFQTMISVVSLAMLKPQQSSEYLRSSPQEAAPNANSQSKGSHYLSSNSSISEITTVLLDASKYGRSPATLAVFAWSIILSLVRAAVKHSQEQRQQLGQGEDDPASRPSIFQDALELVASESLDGDPIELLASRAVDEAGAYELVADIAVSLTSIFSNCVDESCGVQGRLVLLELIRESIPYTRYSSPLVIATLGVLYGHHGYWSFPDRTTSARQDIVREAFVRDTELLVPGTLNEAQQRYPYETLPFLKLCRALSMHSHEYAFPAAQYLETIPTFTQVLPRGFVGYQNWQEDRVENCIELTRDLPLFTSRRELGRMAQNQTQLVLSGALIDVQEMRIPAQSLGMVIRQDKPLIISWNFPHSALPYLINYLSTLVAGNDLVETATQAVIDLDTASEVISLFTAILTASVKTAEDDNAPNPTEDAQRILDESRGSLDPINVIFDVFEQELQRQCAQPGFEGSLELLVSCVQFLWVLTKVRPSRAWPFLTRTRLLENDGAAGSLVAILASTEMIIGRYDFLIGCMRLFEALVDDAITKSIARKAASKALTRFGSSSSSAGGTNEKFMGTILAAYLRILFGVFESCPSWRFDSIDDKLEINTRIMNVFNAILTYVYQYDDTGDLSHKPTAVLAPCGAYLVQGFLSASDTTLPTHPIINVLISGTGVSDSTLFVGRANKWVSQTKAALCFSNTLLLIGIGLDRPTSHLEEQLFKAAPVLARLFALDRRYKSPVTLLLTSMMRSAARTEKEPPSLLGHLGPGTAKSFLSVLSNLDKPFCDIDVESDIWRLLSAVVSCKQQWFAIYLLTGNTPRDSLKSKDSSTSQAHGRPLLVVALDALPDIQKLEPKRALAMLEFVALAQNYWPWATNDIRKHPTFLKGLMDCLGGLRLEDDRPSIPERAVNMALQIRMAAWIAEILAMYIHTARQLGDTAVVKDLIPKFGFFKHHGVTAPAYNTSLHTNLERNLKMKFNACSLTNFKRTFSMREDLGPDYFYDVGFAAKLLGFDPSWSGSKDQGFAHEFARANMNLSLVESQVSLLRSWIALATELSNVMSQDERLPPLIARVVGDCLDVNAQSDTRQTLFERLNHLRVDFAFVLMQKLVEARSTRPEVNTLFSKAWNAIRASGQDFEVAFTGDNADYYRSLLKILFLTLQPHAKSNPIEDLRKSRNDTQASIQSGNEAVKDQELSIVPELLEILSKVVAKGFRSLASQLHEDPQSCSPTDFVLISAILQTILRIPIMHAHHSQIALHFSNNNTSRYATSLFSWSDQLAIDRDPVYGELSVLFLLELSSIPLMAETLAVDGVLAQLSSANLVNYFRRPKGMGPFDEPVRLHSIWTRGILPLCLNLLYAVGPPIAAEVVSFLNQFPNQLACTTNALSNRTTATAVGATSAQVTLGMAAEVHSLALIALVLERWRAAGAAQGINAADLPPLAWDRAGVKEDLEGWMEAKRTLRERIVPVNEREVELARQRPAAGSGAENRLEERVVAEFAAALECLRACNGA